MSTARKVKIAIGVTAFVLIMAVIVWIVALALLESDVKTEVYGTKFDYVDDTMYDNAYIGMSGGKWQLYRGGGAISRSFASLEYVEDGGYFAFINTDGKGWGYVDTSGSIIVEFNQEYQSLLPSGVTTLVGVRQGDREFTVKNGDNRTHKTKGTSVSYDRYNAFYDAYGDRYVLYYDEGDKAVKTESYEEISVPSSVTRGLVSGVESSGTSGFLSIAERGGVVTYDANFAKVNYLDGAYPIAMGKDGDYFEVVGTRAVAYKHEDGRIICRLSDSTSLTVSENEKAVLTNGTSAVLFDGETYRYFDGENSESMNHVRDFALTGGNARVFEHGGKTIVFDDNCGILGEGEIEPSLVEICRTKEKNKAQYTLKLRYLRIGGNLYGYENGRCRRLLSGVESVVTNNKGDSSRIVTRSGNRIVIYDSFFKPTYDKTAGPTAEVIDAYLPVIKDGLKVTMPRGEFDAPSGAGVGVWRCTDEDNYFAVAEQQGKYSVYGKNGGAVGEFTLGEGEKMTISQTQIVVYGNNVVNVVTRNRKLNVEYDEIHFSDNNKYAVAVRSGGLSVINLNDGNITDERFISGGVEIVDKSENTFMLRSSKTGLYGIIDGGKMTLSPTYKFMELHDDFVIAGVDDEDNSVKTYFQADFAGKRLGKTYYDLEVTEGLTVGMNEVGSMEITDARGRVILKDVTYVPRATGGFDFMKCKVYDEETKQTVVAERRDNSLLVVTAGGYKRVVSISRE